MGQPRSIVKRETFTLGSHLQPGIFMQVVNCKGIPDGVGAALERAADRRVLHGADIMNCKSFADEVNMARRTSKLYIIDDFDIKEVEKCLHEKTLKTIPGTMKLHQVIVTSPEHLQFRDASCTCLEKTCPSHSLHEFSVVSWGSKPAATGTTEVKKAQSDPAAGKTRSGGMENKETCLPSSTGKDMKREMMFQEHLAAFQTCGTFSALREMCQELRLQEIAGIARYLQEENLSADAPVLEIFPSDIPGTARCFPVTARADGDCLAAAGSVFAYGNDESPAEFRVRIVKELVLKAGRIKTGFI